MLLTGSRQEPALLTHTIKPMLPHHLVDLSNQDSEKILVGFCPVIYYSNNNHLYEFM